MVSVVWCANQISYLEVEVETLTEQLHSPEVCEEDQNGSVTVDDLDHIQKVNRELEQQLSDKNRVSHLYTHILLFLQLWWNVNISSKQIHMSPFIKHFDVVFPDYQAAATETGRTEEDATEGTGETQWILFNNTSGN